MKKILILNALICFAPASHAWDFSAKADAQQASINNVNLTNTNPESDTYSILNGYVQTKDDTFKIKLKGRTEKYKTHSENDNYSVDLSLQYKRTKTNEYTFALFKQVYYGTPLVSTDTSSDNSGGRLSTTFSKDFDKDTSGYIVLNGSYKKYSQVANRNDKTLGGSVGLEHYFNSTLLINPELLAASNISTDSYYQNTYYGASLYLSYTPTETLEIFVDGSYTHTSYSDRTITTILRNNRTSSEKEYQNLSGAGIGVIYTIANMVPVQVKYSTSTNSSNNSISAYKAEILSFGIGFKF